MSKRDVKDMFPSRPLQDGEKVSSIKKVVNKYYFILQWLYHESVDHRKVTVDDDTDWDDLKNESVYYFNSVNGPNAPVEEQLGSHEGIVICTSAGIGDRYQIALTKSGACFRDVHGMWFYIGHGIPADVDISKLVDQQHLHEALADYVTHANENTDINNIYAYTAKTYVTKHKFNDTVSEQNSEITSDMYSMSSENSLNSVNTSEDISYLSSSTSTNQVNDTSNLNSNTDSLSTETSSLSSQVSSNWASETGSRENNGSFSTAPILSNGVTIPSLSNGTGSIYANTSNINSLNSTVSSESIIDVETHQSLSTNISLLSSSTSSFSASDKGIYPDSNFLNQKVSYFDSLDSENGNNYNNLKSTVDNGTNPFDDSLTYFLESSLSANQSYDQSMANTYRNLYNVSYTTYSPNLQDGSLVSSLSNGIGSVYANTSNIIWLSNSAKNDDLISNGSYTYLSQSSSSNEDRNVTYLNGDPDNPDTDYSELTSNSKVSLDKSNQLASLNNHNIYELRSYTSNATTIQNAPAKSFIADNSSNIDSLQNSQEWFGNHLVQDSKANLVNYSFENNPSASNPDTLTEQITYSSQAKDEGSIYANTSNLNFLASAFSYSNYNLSSSDTSLIDQNANPYNYGGYDNISQAGNALTYKGSQIGSVAANAMLIDSNSVSADSRLDSDDIRFASSDARETSDETNIANNSAVINSTLGFIDKQGKVEMSQIQILGIARGAGTRASNIQGKVVGYFIAKNPHTAPDGQYSMSDLNPSNLMGSGTIMDFTGVNDYEFKDIHSNDILDFTVTQPFVERACALVNPSDATNINRDVGYQLQSSGPLKAMVVSDAASLLSRCISTSQYVGSQGGTVDILKSDTLQSIVASCTSAQSHYTAIDGTQKAKEKADLRNAEAQQKKDMNDFHARINKNARQAKHGRKSHSRKHRRRK